MSIRKLKSVLPKKVIMFGLNSCEHDISIITACLMRTAEMIAIYIDKHNRWYATDHILTPAQFANVDKRMFIACTVLPNSNILYAIKRNRLYPLFSIECALLCFHGNNGEDGAIQGLLTLANIPYTGSNVLASSALMCKITTKKLLSSHGYNIVDYITLDHNDSMEEIQVKVAEFGYPVVIKPASLGSSIGITLVNQPTALSSAVSLALAYDNNIVVERALSNYEEINCAVMRSGNAYVISATEKPLKVGDIYTFGDKYLKDTKFNAFPTQSVDKKTAAKVKQITAKIAKDLNIGGVARVDYLVVDSTIYVNEINTIPGSLAYHLFADKMTKQQFIDSLMEDALRYHKSRNALVHTYNSIVLNGNINLSKK
ncbi:MAG: ATP-grasp domain-containing protein [Clostridia bacterium]|nr:ATP-grasp domain-containing protein [Clostridia bacterium]